MDDRIAKELEDIKAYCERLRSDLSATNTLLLALYEMQPLAIQEKVLPLLAAKMAERERLVGQSVPPEVERAMKQMERSVERLWDEATSRHTTARKAQKPNPGA